MEDLLHNCLLIFGRIITILPLLLFITLFMGRRSIGELPVFDYLVIITLGAVAGADIADPSIRHLETGFAIIAIGLLQRLIGRLKISKRKFGKLITFEPVIVIHKGKFLSANLKKYHYSIDNILQMLRDKQVFDVQYVELGILEGNGMLSVQLKPAQLPATKGDLNISGSSSQIAFPVIVEGTVYREVLERFDVDQDWLDSELSRLGISRLQEIFFASISPEKELHISLKNEQAHSIPSLYH
ncbi:DUF421 domain-containing protein [Bacillus infantis]|uniref:DUF421 domain-containing protein n=1 Tax=Bacillus infantis TaxID=324767 RepID=UPI003CEEED1E